MQTYIEKGEKIKKTTYEVTVTNGKMVKISNKEVFYDNVLTSFLESGKKRQVTSHNVQQLKYFCKKLRYPNIEVHQCYGFATLVRV